MDEPAEEAKPKHSIDDVTADYANNVAFESTIWDLKLIFGEYSDRVESVEWHTSITIPWAQAKLMQYYLQINIESFESQHGKIHVPLVPPEPAAPPPDDLQAKAFYELVTRHREKFLQSLK